MDWIGDYCDVFMRCLDSHSDGTHSLQRIHWWASDVMLHFSKSVPMKKQTHLHLGWPDCVSTFSENVGSFWWSIPLPVLSLLVQVQSGMSAEVLWNSHSAARSPMNQTHLQSLPDAQGLEKLRWNGWVTTSFCHYSPLCCGQHDYLKQLPVHLL